ncbi:MAG: hypothetical protein A2Y16_00070 [Tenericutes bacterium GWF2_57_13]|nr:MAG: hypothetical protein A2Y16_00070 [Tenericutes bacterium GWF2_57_13]
MTQFINVKCRKILVKEKSFYSQQETVFRGPLEHVVTEVLEWYKNNIRYYEKRDGWGRITLPIVPTGKIMFFFLVNITMIMMDLAGPSKPSVNLEINDDCVYISGGRHRIDYSTLFQNVDFQKIWTQVDDHSFDVGAFLEGKYDRKEIVQYRGSIYVNYKDVREKKFYFENNQKVTEKELLIRDALRKSPQSTSSDISRITGIPPRTIRYYLQKIDGIQTFGSSKSPNRAYALIEEEIEDGKDTAKKINLSPR